MEKREDDDLMLYQLYAFLILYISYAIVIKWYLPLLRLYSIILRILLTSSYPSFFVSIILTGYGDLHL